jgi:hypothetical protein
VILALAEKPAIESVSSAGKAARNYLAYGILVPGEAYLR